MLTPAEELGLSGLSLASRVRKAFYKIPEADLVGLLQAIRDEAMRRHLVYLHEGHPDAIHVMACPLTVLPNQLAYIHNVTLTIQNALKRLLDLYFKDEQVRATLKLADAEEAWIRDCYNPTLAENNPIFGRHDAVVDFISPMWKDTLRYVEPNLSGIGGLHLIPTAERLIADIVLPRLRKHDETLRLEVGQDIRELLMQDVLDHLEALGRPARNICFIDPKYVGIGPDEQEELARYFHERYGLRVTHSDPSELSVQGDEVYCGGVAVDLVYRDYAVIDLLDRERQGLDLAPLRLLFKQNRVISSLTAELDQKSCWEVLTDPVLTQKYFNADERHVFRRHVLWTRLVYERRTMLPDGQEGDLLAYARREHDTLVLKPNRAYGGTGVVLGSAVTAQEWEAALQSALADTKDRWVVQQLANLPVSEFPVVSPDGSVAEEPFYVVMGFAATRFGLATLGRASQKQVVNVAQRGGMCVVFLGQPVGRLLGPLGR